MSPNNSLGTEGKQMGQAGATGVKGRAQGLEGSRMLLKTSTGFLLPIRLRSMKVSREYEPGTVFAKRTKAYRGEDGGRIGRPEAHLSP